MIIDTPPGGSLGSIAVVLVALRVPLGSSVSAEPDSAAVVVAAESSSELDSVVEAAVEESSVADAELSSVLDGLSVDEASCVVDESSSCLLISPSILLANLWPGQAAATVVKTSNRARKVLTRPWDLMMNESLSEEAGSTIETLYFVECTMGTGRE